MTLAIAIVLAGAPYGAASADPVSDSEEPSAAVTVPNSMSNLVVKQGRDGDWRVEFDYVYAGDPRGALFRIELPLKAGTESPGFRGSRNLRIPAQLGRHHVNTTIEYPGDGTSEQVIVTFVGSPDGSVVIAREQVDQVIKWPTQDERDFNEAVALIENGRSELIREARLTLERLVTENPRFDDGYIELARVAMKLNWGPEGLHQAETLLDSALAIRPENVNGKILLGYVYTRQGRLDEALPLFEEAASEDPPNYWVWVNWGELLEMQGDPGAAMVKYREAIRRPITSIRHRNARLDAYRRLLRLLAERNAADEMEALYEQRIQEFGPGSCYSTDYARFKLEVRGDAQAAINIARDALNLDCDDAPSRRMLGLANYVKWAEGDGPESAEALNQARIFLPTGPTALYLLARSQRTVVAVTKLVTAGEAIDQKDNDEMTALALALRSNELDAARRLLDLGARPEALVSPAAVPVALLPVVGGDFEGIALMRQAGVDYSKLSFRGMTALDFAKQVGDNALLEALAPLEQAL